MDSTLRVSDSTLHNWMKQDFSNTAICPPLTDYCPACYQFNVSIESAQISINLHKVYLLNKYDIVWIIILLIFLLD